MRLEDNTTTQRQLNDSAFHAGMDLKAKKIDQKVEVSNLIKLRYVDQFLIMLKYL